MKKSQTILFAISSIALYIGAIYFFIQGNTDAGIMGTFAGTVTLAAVIINLKKQK